MLTKRFAVHLNRSLVGLLGIAIEKTDVAHLRSFPCVVVKKTFQFTCGDPETEVDLILSRAGIFETPKDIDDFTICPTHRSNLGTGVGWIRGSISRCRKISGIATGQTWHFARRKYTAKGCFHV